MNQYDTMMIKRCFLAIVIGAIMINCICAMVCVSIGAERIQEEAIAHGYAEKVVENNQIVFKWKSLGSETAELK